MIGPRLTSVDASDVLHVFVRCICVIAEAGLGDGPRWDLKEACAAKDDEVTREEVDKELEGHEDLVKTLEYMEQLEREIASMRAGSDARGIKMLGQALSGSDDADVQFVFEGGQATGVRGHRGMLCAGSEEYCGMFRSGMVEEQEGVIGVPPGVSEAGYRGLLEWVYLGEGLFPCCACLVILCLHFMSGREGAFVGV